MANSLIKYFNMRKLDFSVTARVKVRVGWKVRVSMRVVRVRVLVPRFSLLLVAP